MDTTTLSSTEMLDGHAVARLCGVQSQTVKQWRVRGMGPPYHKVGGAIRYRAADVCRYLEEHRVEPAA